MRMKGILFFVILLFIPFVDAAKLGASPSRLYFNGSVGENVCNKIVLNSQEGDVLYGELKFSNNYASGNNVLEYSLEPEKLSISADYSKNIIFNENIEKFDIICIKGNKAGKFKGVLIYKSKYSYAGIGIWTFLNIKKNNYDNIKTGLLLTPSIFLSFLLLILLIKKSSKNNIK